ncbi:nephronectin isoform X2 [Amphiprion ocellaris]|nr:nephronectin isoform X2 [Amphiprion ocellaris]XP_054863373.1 nephronectin isoform X2 [Amphiprion ocellaris]XP_054863374.1 nephronectin isoform X2 [Amphiprion ocellaris]XP_054863375.1 nephronectin isoform X2 [Amphiprion ocellaris]XP_054863376.1 nephronectin isoform X2 [Amphiprion ocellaris]XP_054863377.1 nephronectin isoform X2 [Amphiprion ocellaris]
MTSDGLCRYGNSVECCWGWRPTDRGRCQPDCQQGCKHGDCVGPDRCKCRPGYTGKACNHDLNECGLKPRPCKHRCMNTAGSYKCYCLDGFTLQEDGSCRNARTCYHANCQYGCEVIKGAVRCTCPSPGLRLGPDGRTCIDVDECLSGRFVCARRRKCVNTFGSYTCRCHLGFRLMFIDGRYSCIDKDTRTFCSLNPSSPKCRCKDGSCRDVPKVSLEPQKPRTTTPTTTTTTTPTTTTTTTTTSTTTTARPTTTTTVLTTTTTLATTIPATTDAATTKTTTSIPTTTTTTITTSIPVTTTATTTPVTTTTTTPTTPPPTTTISTSIPNTLVTTTELDTTTPTIPPPPPPPTTTPTTTTTTTATTPSTAPLPTITTTTTPTTPPSTTPPPTTTVTTVTMVVPVTTTVSNRIINDVTHKQRGDVHIPRHPGHNQVWEFDIELGNTADDARDDPDVGVLHCSFDGGVCGWMSDGDGDLDWETVDNPAVGRYLSVPELKAGQRSIRGARLAVQIAPTWRHGDLCFSFSHWLTGHHVGVLQLFVRKTGRDQRYGSALWSRTGGHGWRHTQVTLTTQSVDMVLLKAERRIGRRGQIAIDDVTLRRGACR